MGRGEIWTQVYLISKSMLFLLLYTVFHTIPYKKMTFWSLHLLFHKFDFSSKCCSWQILGLCSLTLREDTYWVALHGTLGQCFSGRASGKWIGKRGKGSDYVQEVLRISMWGWKAVRNHLVQWSHSTNEETEIQRDIWKFPWPQSPMVGDDGKRKTHWGTWQGHLCSEMRNALCRGILWIDP